MKTKNSTQHEKIQKFVEELSGFAAVAEETLEKIESNSSQNKSLFSVFSERMFAIRGTAQQLNLPHIAKIAGLGEEIAIKGSHPDSKSHQIRKCVGSLWDALTTVKYLLQHYTEETNEEQNILVARLENTLRVLGGARPTLSTQEIDEALAKMARGK